MKTSTQASADLAHVAALIDDIPIAMLTTTEADGALTSRPMAVLEMDEQGALWFFTDSRSSKTEQLRTASLSGDHGTGARPGPWWDRPLVQRGPADCFTRSRASITSSLASPSTFCALPAICFCTPLAC